MSQSADEARAARIQRYKEERRKQLTARTATLFSANVTERRPKREAAGRSPLEDTATNLKSSSELNINIATTSVPIRTTRTSRLRAAAANNSDTCQSPKRSNRRSSSELSLLEDDKTKTSKNAKILDRDKTRINYRRQINEKENFKSSLTTCFPERDNGAIRSKLKHSTNKNIIEKDKNISLAKSPRERNVDGTGMKTMTDDSKLDNKDDGNVDVDEILNDILADDKEKDRYQYLYNDITVDSNIKVNVSVSDEASSESELKYSHKNSCIPVKDKLVDNDSVKLVGVPNVKSDVGLLGAVCVRKVERFSELLSNLCSPCEADILFEDVLVENGINGNSGSRVKAPECTPPCRRLQPSPRVTSTPKRAPNNDADGK
ncbi:hypothetical protein KGM_201940 [Danaus plexippus plexippus]|uniref:Uncharacterized protein n=1 Tax=Danaus plexippus plexippus TaxID=278856 RepID=A0A212FLQ9_DANPL|nr:uncharacterized protein LOC116772749 [Danaus plexippus plexippus]XP_032520919.1 uncharacterized protein LOC116772749 [Danaus plexippus plexippus]OWR54667.1 hypothetical protein KGM_201940 [Danaus plexippus plexippus]